MSFRNQEAYRYRPDPVSFISRRTAREGTKTASNVGKSRLNAMCLGWRTPRPLRILGNRMKPVCVKPLSKLKLKPLL